VFKLIFLGAKLNFLWQFAFDMGKNRDIGQKGEELAATFLETNGYQVLAKNYRHRRSEIDLVCQKNQVIVFVEVKRRKNNAFGYPESFVEEAQANRIKEGAEQFLIENGWEGPIRFDILAISGTLDKDLKINHFEDAF
jgi:putative endonuclease